MSFKEFENALELLASNKGVSGEELRQQVAASAGPLCNATQAAAVRLHDDRSTYTGQFVIGCTQPAEIEDCFNTCINHTSMCTAVPDSSCAAKFASSRVVN